MKDKICQECSERVKVDGVWCCEECFKQPISELDECPLGITNEEFQENIEKGEEVKIKLNAKQEQDKPKEKTSRPKKISENKKFIYSYLLEKMQEFVAENGGNCEIGNENKLILLDFNGKKYKIDLIEQRK